MFNSRNSQSTWNISYPSFSVFASFGSYLGVYYILAGAQPDIFQGRGGFVELGHFDKYFAKRSRKNAPQRKNLQFFLLDTLKTTNTEIFAFIAVLVFKLLSCRVLFANRKDNRNC